MLVTPEDLKTEMFQEILDQITRRNPEELKLQIKAAEDFAKGYLFKYDLKALFGTDTEAPTHPDENLKKVVKVIASYWLARKCGANTNVDLFREDWLLMVGTKNEPGWLTDVKEGRVNPEWPYRKDETETANDESQDNNDVSWSSNTKRTQRF